MSDQINPFIRWAAQSVQDSLEKGTIFRPGRSASPEALTFMKSRNKPLGDYAELRGTITLEELNQEVESYLQYLNSTEGNNRKAHFLKYLMQGQEEAEQQGIGAVAAIGKAILAYEPRGDNDPSAPTPVERILALEMLNAVVSSEYEILKR